MLILVQSLKNLMSLSPVLKGCSRLDGTQIFKNSALPLCETLIWGFTSVIESKRPSRLDGVHILHVHDLRFSS
jgi:hypothetical protein